VGANWIETCNMKRFIQERKKERKKETASSRFMTTEGIGAFSIFKNLDFLYTNKKVYFQQIKLIKHQNI
jgi:hypothetical protein